MTGAKKGIPARDVGAYLSSVPHDQWMILEQLRRAIKAAAPNVEEVISYRIPTYKYRGPLVHFMAHKDYCSFIVASKAVVQKFKSALADYDISGTTIHFLLRSSRKLSRQESKRMSYALTRMNGGDYGKAECIQFRDTEWLL